MRELKWVKNRKGKDALSLDGCILNYNKTYAVGNEQKILYTCRKQHKTEHEKKSCPKSIILLRTEDNLVLLSINGKSV